MPTPRNTNLNLNPPDTDATAAPPPQTPPSTPPAAAAAPTPAPKKTTHQDYVARVTITHPATSFSVAASFHLIDPSLCTDPDAYNVPALKRLERFITQNISL